MLFTKRTIVQTVFTLVICLIGFIYITNFSLEVLSQILFFVSFYYIFRLPEVSERDQRSALPLNNTNILVSTSCLEQQSNENGSSQSPIIDLGFNVDNTNIAQQLIPFQSLATIVLMFNCIFAAFCLLFNKNPIYALLSLIMVFFNAIVLLLTLKIEFLALTFLIIYVGAIAILFLFVIMMFNLKKLQSIKTQAT